MNTPENHPLQESAKRDATISVRYFVCSAIGGILCVTGTISQEELLAYVWLGAYFLLWWTGFAYRVWAEHSLREHNRISAR